MLLFACTIFLSAFLLFEVQPMIGKIILPWFGGSASVWSACLLFFQAALLAGYLYAHCVTRYLKPKQQAALHLILMAISVALLPILPSPRWKPLESGDPSGRILLLLTTTIGLPYILLSTTTPLLQAWYVAAKPGSIPYRMFALSNFGSMLALLIFPVLVEPSLGTRAQAFTWSGVYVIFVLLCAAVAWKTPRRYPKATSTGEPTTEILAPAWNLCLMWTALAACASALLLSITNHLSQNVAPIPFLWVAPLAIYLLSFIICFEREKGYRRPVFLPLLAVSLGAAAYAIYYEQGNLAIKRLIPVFLATLFVCCMVCHGELARLKPDPRHLTSFYLMVSLGGVLGGLFVAVVAPHLFDTYFELLLLLVACPALVATVLWFRPGEWTRKWLLLSVRFAMIAVTVALAGYLGYKKRIDDRRFERSVRNFYAVLRVLNVPETADQTAVRRLIHGTIDHGEQILAASERRTPTSYYGATSGMGRAIRHLQQKPHVRIGVVGLGAGVTAAYCRPGDVFRFYEINPLDLKIANTWFTFLSDCPADHQVLLGDARITMERQTSQQFDVMAIDAFTSDAIPMHLLTREAFELYFRHLQPSGILAVHISNRYLDLAPVVMRNARDLGKTGFLVKDDPAEPDYLSESDWILVSSDSSLTSQAAFQGATIEHLNPPKGFRPWTDDYSNLFQILK